MRQLADAAAAALGATWRHWVAAAPDGWFCRKNGLFAAVTGTPVPTLNGVWTEEVDFDQQVASELLEQVGRRGVPYCLQMRPGAAERGSLLPAVLGMDKDGQLPLMVLEDPSALESALRVEGLAIRRLDPEEAAIHNGVAARGFDVPEEVLQRLTTRELLRKPGTRCYVGEVGGVAVTTGVGVTVGPFVGIFNIATPPEFRRRGYGAAVTARVARDGFDDGASRSFLQSSADGHNVYVQLGFRTVERWDCWICASPGLAPSARTS